MAATETKIVAGKWGCERCTANGTCFNAVVVAARHARARRHPTWAEETRRFSFGALGVTKSNSQGSML